MFSAQLPKTNASTTYKSICNFHGFFHNQKSDLYSPAYNVAQFKLNVERSNIDQAAPAIYIQCRQRVLQNSAFALISPYAKERLINYFSLIEYSMKEAHLVKMGLGNCGEAVSESIINTLSHQLQNNHFETIQIITLWTEDLEINHSFVIYNAPLINSQQISNKNVAKLFKNLKSDNEDPIIICDGFEAFHGRATKWHKHFFDNQQHLFSQYKYSKMQVNDMTIPIFNADLTVKQIEAIKNELANILSDNKEQVASIKL